MPPRKTLPTCPACGCVRQHQHGCPRTKTFSMKPQIVSGVSAQLTAALRDGVASQVPALRNIWASSPALPPDTVFDEEMLDRIADL